MKKIIITAICSLLIHTALMAQSDRVESLRVAFITKRLSLTSEEAKIFWPIYAQYKKDGVDLRNKYKSVLKAEPEDLINKSEAESEKMLNEMIAYRQAQVDLTKRYIVEFSKAISKKKIVLLYKAEEDFKRELIKKLQKAGQRPINGDE